MKLINKQSTYLSNFKYCISQLAKLQYQQFIRYIGYKHKYIGKIRITKQMLTNNKNRLKCNKRVINYAHFIYAIILICAIECGPVLDNFPITFEMSGETSYIPDSGGVARNGYKLKIGYAFHQWLAAQIITGTNKNDVLVLQINEFYTQGSTPIRTGHEVSITDYFTQGDGLVEDQNQLYDISSFNYTESKQYSINVVRYLGANSGEDWNAAANKYSLMQVCFYTSKNLFSIDNWKSGLKECYFFQIDNMVSEFKGVKLKNFYLSGYTTGIYGWIDGPYVSDNIYIYQQVPLFAYTKQPAVIIQIGTTTANAGQDFNAHSPIATESGDYYGQSVTNMTKDNSNSGGFQNSGLVLKHWNADPATQISGLSFTSLRITYSRNVTTFDPYDKQLKSTFIFCMYLYAVGSINGQLTDKSCQVVELSYHYPRMAMPVKLYEVMKWSVYLCVILIVMVLVGL